MAIAVVGFTPNSVSESAGSQFEQPASSAQHVSGAGAADPTRPGCLFIENRGQFPELGPFVAPVRDGLVSVEHDGFVVQRVATSSADADDGLRQNVRAKGVNLRFSFEGCLPSQPRGTDPLSTHVNFYGAQGAFEDVPVFSSVRCDAVWSGIDVVFLTRSGVLAYDIELAPHASVEDVTLRCDGAESLSIGDDGSLISHTALGAVTQSPPIAFAADTGARLACRFVLRDAVRIGFSVPDWHGYGPLLIDPGIAFGTYLDSAGADQALAVAVAADGSACVGGRAGYLDFPTTPGSFAATSQGESGFIARLTSDGSDLIYSTFIDGTGWLTIVKSLALTPDGKAVMAGYSQDQSFSTTGGAFDTTFNGGEWDGVVLQLAAENGALEWATYLGGSGDDFLRGVVVDGQGSIYVCGSSTSTDYPTTNGAFDTLNVPPGDVVITKLAPDGAALQYSTFLGGGESSGEEANAIALDADGSVVVTGWAAPGFSADFPVTVGAFDESFNGFGDGFVARLDASGGTLGFCTLIGGVAADIPYAVCIAPDHSIYVAGRTDSSKFPTTPGALDPTYSGLGDGFIAHFGATGSDLLEGTLLGATSADEIRGLGIDLEGLVVAGGDTNSAAFPVSPDALDPTKNLTGESGSDGFVVRLDPTLAELQFGTFVGGGGPGGTDQVWGVAIDEAGAAYLVGQTTSSIDFPVTPGAFDDIADGNDAFLVKVDLSPWSNLGGGTGGAIPHLVGTGSLQPGSAGSLALGDAAPGKLATLVTGLAALNVPFKNGVMVPEPLLLVFVVTDANGEVSLAWTAWPDGVPAHTSIYFQAWIPKPVGGEFWASNALLAWTPIVVGS